MREAEITNLHLFRHGQVVESAASQIYGQQDVPLSSNGQQQSMQLSAWFAKQQPQIEAVFSSDLLRCQFLADLLSRQCDIRSQCSPELREQNFGAWQGKSWLELQNDNPQRVAQFWKDYVKAVPLQGESYAELNERILRWWQQTLISNAGQNIVVVTHAGCIRVLVAHLIGMAVEQSMRLCPALASYTHLSIGQDGAVLRTFSRTVDPPSPR